VKVRERDVNVPEEIWGASYRGEDNELDDDCPVYCEWCLSRFSDLVFHVSREGLLCSCML